VRVAAWASTLARPSRKKAAASATVPTWRKLSCLFRLAGSAGVTRHAPAAVRDGHGYRRRQIRLSSLLRAGTTFRSVRMLFYSERACGSPGSGS
jgi:hypothetical protein